MTVDLNITEGKWVEDKDGIACEGLEYLIAYIDQRRSRGFIFNPEGNYGNENCDIKENDNKLAVLCVPQFKALADEVEEFLESRGYDVELVNVLVKLKCRIKELKSDE